MQINEEEETKGVQTQIHAPDSLLEKNKPVIICIIPFALPSSGKSFFMRAI